MDWGDEHTRGTLDSPDDEIPEESPVLDALERFAEFVDEVFDKSRPTMQMWEGNVDQLAIRSVGRILCKWRHASRVDRPPHALIVRLAQRLPILLAEVCSTPKRLLKRRRTIQPLSRLRELDSTCVRWVTRQPGISLVEKAGHRRAIMAVERFESLNTLENRVVFSLLRLCRALADDYLRQHQAHFPYHDRIRATKSFLRLCDRLLRSGVFAEVSPLKSIPKPNYVLLHDDRYHKIWRSYLQVVRQQRRRRLLWTYRRQAFADMATIALLYAVRGQTDSRTARRTAHRHELALRHTPLQGSFIDWRLAPPMWQMDDDTSVFVGPACFASSLLGNGDRCDRASALVLIRRHHTQIVRSLTFHLPESRKASECLEFDASQVRVEVQALNNEFAVGAVDEQFSCPVALVDHPDAFRDCVARWCR